MKSRSGTTFFAALSIACAALILYAYLLMNYYVLGGAGGRTTAASGEELSASSLVFLAEAPPPLGAAPLDCPSFLSSVSSKQRLDVVDPNGGRMYARLTTTSPPFFMSMHEESFDEVRFEIFRSGAYYERVMTEAFAEILKEDRALPDRRVLDVGGNIGWFTFLAASLDYHVDVFEPNLVNGLRICEAMKLNELVGRTEGELARQTASESSVVNYYPFGVGSVDESKTFYVPTGSNPGVGSYIKFDQSIAVDVGVVTLDKIAEDKGWFKSRPAIAILKIDVEGFEPQAIEGALRLLRSGMVENIFMESRNGDDEAVSKSMYDSITEAGFRLHKYGGWAGPDKLFGGGPASDGGKSTSHFLDQLRAAMPAQSINLWWKLQ